MGTIIFFLLLTLFFELIMNVPAWLGGTLMRPLSRIIGAITWLYLVAASALGVWKRFPFDDGVALSVFGLCWGGFMLLVLGRCFWRNHSLVRGPVGFIAWVLDRRLAPQTS